MGKHDLVTKPCDGCPVNDYCSRHALYKGAGEVELCKRDQVTRAYLDKTAEDRRNELVGTRLANMLKAAGITRERYGAVKQWLGLPPTCDCAEREEWMNRLDALAYKQRAM